MNRALPDECAGARRADRLAAFVVTAGFDPTRIVDICCFGDTNELIDRLAELVVSGPMRVTTSLLRWYGPGGERMPVTGDLFLIVGSGCVPRAVARMTR